MNPFETDTDDVIIEVEEPVPVLPPVSNSFLDPSVLLTILFASLLVLLLVVLVRRSDRRPRRPQVFPEWVESREDPNESLEDLRSKRVRSFQNRSQVPSEEPEGVPCEEPEIAPAADRGPGRRPQVPLDRSEVSKSLPALKSNSMATLPPPKHRPSSQDTQEIFLKSKPKGKALSLCRSSGLPCISPIHSLEELDFWYPGQDPWNEATVPLRVSEKYRQLGEPRTLLCHDMMGGYLYDKYPQGHWESGNYCFYHWAYIDTFVYFSHSFLTIPPSCWTNAAHRHGVVSLGTLITEGERGYASCLEMLKSHASIGRTVDQLLTITKYYAFDGWLVNIENPLPPNLIERMVEFLKQLSFGIKRLNPNGAVIWYDAVTVRGELSWQNKLNQLNRSFFDACDGIFLNYLWSDLALRETRQLAGGRATDVYVGVDVFGRGVPGDGGWNCDFAMKMIRNHKLSAAIFAPGWVYENLAKENFFRNQTKFWDKLKPYMRTHPYVTDQFVTSFCRGLGSRGFHQGRQLLASDWTNHSAQQLQPHFLDEYYHLGKSANNILVDHLYVSAASDAFNGAQSLVCNGEVFRNAIGSDSRLIVRLFMTEIAINRSILVTYTYKERAEYEGNIRHLLELNLSNLKGPKYIILDPKASIEGPEELDKLDQRLLELYGVRRSPAAPLTEVGVHRGTEDQNLAYAPIAHEYLDKLDSLTLEKVPEEWHTSYFLIAHKDIHRASVREIRINLLPPELPVAEASKYKFSFSIGEIRIMDPGCLNSFNHPVHNLKASSFDWSDATADSLSVSFMLKWDSPPLPPTDPASHYNVYLATDKNVSHNNTEFVGQTHTNYFYVRNVKIKLNSEQLFVLFAVVQAVATSGLCLAIKKSAKLQLKWNK